MPGFSLNKEQVTLSQVIQYGAIETSEELKEPGIGLKNTLESGDLPVKGDSNLLVSCLVNLIRFAEEHTSLHGEILITTSEKGTKVECMVEDQGTNYSNTLFDLLSNHFSTKDSPLNLNMGIGLAVSRMVMEAHGGYLVFEKTKDENGKMKMVFQHE